MTDTGNRSALLSDGDFTGFKESILSEIELRVCELESLGESIRILCIQESEVPDLTCLADLGKLVSRQAMATIDFILDARTPPGFLKGQKP